MAVVWHASWSHSPGFKNKKGERWWNNSRHDLHSTEFQGILRSRRNIWAKRCLEDSIKRVSGHQVMLLETTLQAFLRLFGVTWSYAAEAHVNISTLHRIWTRCIGEVNHRYRWGSLRCTKNELVNATNDKNQHHTIIYIRRFT